MIVLTCHDDQACSVGCCVKGCPGESKPKGVGPGLCDRFIQLLLQIGEQICLGHFESSWIPCLRDRVVEFIMGGPTHIVEVQGVGRIVWPGNVGVGPMGSELEIEHRVHAYITGPNDATDTLNLYDVSGAAHYELYHAIAQAGNPAGLEVTQADLLSDLK